MTITLEEKIQMILEGKDPNALQVVPASVDPTITDPVTNEIQPEVTPNATAPEVEDPTQGNSDEPQEEPTVALENPLSVDPIETEDPEQPSDENKEKVEEACGKKEELEEMAMDSLNHPTHGKLAWENDGGVHKIKRGDRTVFSGTHAEVAEKWKAIKNTVTESVDEVTEALRIVSKHGEGQYTAKVYRNPEFDEHQVKFFKDGKHVGEDGDYFTNDLEDAKNTADSQIKRYNSTNESTDQLLATDANLSEEFQAKAKEAFQEELATRTKAVEEEYTVKLAQVIENLEVEKQEYINTLSEKIDIYLDTISEAWAANNKPILESNAQIEISNSFMQKMKALFEEHNIEVPETKRDIVIEMETKMAEMQSQITSITEALTESAAELAKMNKEKLINESIKGMTELDQSRMSVLIEDIEYTNAEAFGKKIQTIKESVFMKPGTVLNEDKLKVSSLPITESATPIVHSPVMELYLKALQG